MVGDPPGVHGDRTRHALGWLAHHQDDGVEDHEAAAIGGFSAETGAALAIYTATHLGVGISTTHTITGAIVGVGSTRRLSAVRWGVAGQIVWAWLLTIPASAVIGR
jgi:PiT family inorganic phosphate transporter